MHAVPDGTMRLLQKDEVLAILPDLYDRCARRRAGSMSRVPVRYLERGLEDVLGGIKPSFVAVHSDPSGTMDGYVKYSIAWDESENDDVGRGVVDDLFGADAAVERALWAYLLGIDLIDEWRAEQRPIDEAVRFAFADMPHTGSETCGTSSGCASSTSTRRCGRARIRVPTSQS